MDDRSPTGVGLGLRWAFIDEVARGETPPSIRFFEISPENYIRRGGRFPSALETIAAEFPILTHGLMLGVGGEEALEPGYIRDLRGVLDALGGRRHTDHLCWSDAGGRCLHDLLPLPVDRRIIPAISDRIRRVQDLLGRPFAVENISYYGAPGWSELESATMGMVERDFLAELLEHADCGLLLDVNNVLVNATNHGFDPYAYLEGIDLSRVVELHIAGGERFDHLEGLLIDTHGTSVPAEVEALMAWVVARCGPLPVIYERDNNVPSLAELGDEVARLQRSYDAALARFDADAAQSGERRHSSDLARPPELPQRPRIDLGQVQRSFARRVLDLPGEVEEPPRATPDPTAAALSAMGDARIGVYRSLVRGSIHGLFAKLLPRTLARLEGAGSVWIDRWLAEEGPRSRILRELIDEWVAWAGPRWRADPSVADHLVDLLRHEAVEMATGAAPPPAPPPGMSPEFALDAALVCDPSARIARYDHAIHRLPEELDDRSSAPAEPTALLVYRDREHSVRFLHLSPLAAAISERLIAGLTVKEALFTGTQALDIELDDEVLARVTRLLADFAERGIILGSMSVA